MSTSSSSFEEGLHRHIEIYAKQRPSELAVKDPQTSLSYDELNRRSNRLARKLRAMGVGTDALVPISVGRSVDLVVGLVGILKAGGAFVPLNPSWSAEQVTHVLAQSGTVAVASESGTMLHLLSNIQTVAPGVETCGSGSTENESDLNVAIAASNLAYVLYTSGSTGLPKGAMNTHGGILNRLQWMKTKFYSLRPERVMQKTPITFDVAICEIFWPLLSGATLILPGPFDHLDSDALVRTIIQEQVSTVHFVPSMLRSFLAASDVERCFSLRRVISSGEVLTSDLKKQFFSRLNCDLFNLYGPTETAIDASFWKCDVEDKRDLVPIGVPLPNVSLFVMDKSLNVVPTGVIGELYIGGAGVGRGYLARPAKTAECFLPDASGNFGGRLFSTGDLARWNNEGFLEFFGRHDDQIKFNGIRIRLSEIEAALLRHDNVDAAVVQLRGQTGHLVAFVVLRSGMLDDAGTKTKVLRSWLKACLPSFMVPTYFQYLHAFPLLTSGKVDRQELAARDIVELDRHYVEEKVNSDEEKVLECMRRVLGSPGLLATDNFFENGGHSILVLYLVAQLRSLEFHFSPEDIFQYQSAHELAQSISLDLPKKPLMEITEQLITSLFEELLCVSPVLPTDDFFALGGTDAQGIRLLERLRSVSGQDVSLFYIHQAHTPKHLTELLQTRGLGHSRRAYPHYDSPLVRIKDVEGSSPLFMVSPMSGLVASPRPAMDADLGRYLSPNQAFHRIQPPPATAYATTLLDLCLHQPEVFYSQYLATLISDEKMLGAAKKYWVVEYGAISRIARECIVSMRLAQPEGPYCLAGVSSGGVVAFEMAKQLEEEGLKVSFLGLIDSHFDPLDYQRSDISKSEISAAAMVDAEADADSIAWFMTNELVWSSPQMDEYKQTAKEILAIEKASRWDAITDSLRKKNIVPATMSQNELLKLYLTHIVYRIDRGFLWASLKAYQPKGSVNRIVLFKALDHSPPGMDGRTYWSQVSRQGVHVVPVPGDHNTMFSPQNIGHLAAELQRCLDDAAS